MINGAGWFGLGAVTGWLSILSQHWTVSRLGSPNNAVGVVWFILGIILRWMAAAALIFFGLRAGLFTGLAAAGGLLLARWLALLYYSHRLVREV
ncbi:MAG: hypothetical protein IH586_15795 [Anaerolineaceae bacterium]|nr:hypothetical protein [Anaerolineaceae bacterium]